MDITLIKEMSESICDKYGYKYPEIVLMDETQFFGNCSYRGVITLNKQVCELNYAEIVENILKHEIAHLKYRNHGADFEAECKRMGISRHTRFDHPIIKTRYAIHLFKCSTCLIKNECNKILNYCSTRIKV